MKKEINVELEEIIGRLYPYYDKRDTLPLSAWGYLFNKEDPKHPVFWPSDMEHFRSFTEFLSSLGYIGLFQKVEKKVGDQTKTEYICTKLKSIEHKKEKSGHPVPGED